MGKKIFTITFLLVFLGSAISAFAYPLGYGLNEIEIKSRESLFRWNDNNSRYEELDYSNNQIQTIEVGDIFVGVSRISTILDSGGFAYTSIPDVTDLTGVFVQEIKAISLGSLSETTPAGDTLLTDEAFISLGATTASTFYALKADGSFDDFTLSLSGDEQFAFYLDENPNTTSMDLLGPLETDINEVLDGELFFTAGFSYGGDADADGSIYNDGDDDGYAYARSKINVALNSFDGSTFAGMNIIQNKTGWPNFVPLIDGDDTEAITWMDNPGVDIYFNADMDNNPNYARGGQSPFLIDDPAWIHVVPEPGTFFLFGVGLLGFSSFARRKKRD